MSGRAAGDNADAVRAIKALPERVSFCAPRPADMIDGPEAPYECHPTLQGNIFSGAKSTRASVGRFMADLATEPDVWDEWMNTFPHIFDAAD